MNASDILAVKAAQLARMNNPAWGEFMTAFRDYVDAQRDALVATPIEQLQVTQGKAQALRDLQRNFDSCMKTADSVARAKPAS